MAPDELSDLKRHQYVLSRIIESSFEDLDIDSATVTRWRPYNGKPSGFTKFHLLSCVTR